MTETNPEQLAERYIAAVDAFDERVRSVPSELVDYRENGDSWSARDVALHVADVDQLLGLRLRQILSDDSPNLAAINTRANIERLRKARVDRALALEILASTSAMNAALVEILTPAEIARKGHHPHGHDVTAGDIAMFLAMHIEAHVKQIARVLKAAQAR